MVDLPGGWFLMGSDDPDGFPADGEGPVRRVRLAPFRIDRYATSNRRFAEFADATGYRTDAERYGWSFVFAGLLPDDYQPTSAGRRSTLVAAGVRRRLAAPGRRRHPP